MKILYIIAGSTLCFFLSACGGSGNSKSSTTASKTSICQSQGQETLTMSLKVTNNAQSEPEYLIERNSLLNGIVSAQGEGSELLAWNFYTEVGNRLFVSGYENGVTESYCVDDSGSLNSLASFSYENPLELFYNYKDTSLLASNLPRLGPAARTLSLYTIDAETGQVSSIVPYNITHTDSRAFEADFHDCDPLGENRDLCTMAVPTGMVVRGDRLFLSYQEIQYAFITLLNPSYPTWTNPFIDTANVAIFDYPLIEGAQPTLIEDNRTSDIGVNGSSSGIIMTEFGDIYSFSNGSTSAEMLHHPTDDIESPRGSIKPSGILKIANAEESFSNDYFFNISEKTNGGTIFSFDYLGNNKAIARIITTEDDCLAEQSFANPVPCLGIAYKKFTHSFKQKLVILDLASQSVTDIVDQRGVPLPLHQKRYSSPIQNFDGKAYVSVETQNDEAYIWQIDIATATAIKGAKIEGKTIKGFYQLHK